MDNSDRSTPISQINVNNNSNDTVNNILQNFNELDDTKEPPEDEQFEYEYATDKSVYIPENKDIPLNTQTVPINSDKIVSNKQYNTNNRKKSFTNRLLNFIKSPLIVFCIIFIFNLQFFDKYFTYLVKKSSNIHGDLTLIGLCMKSLLGAILFYLFNNIIF